MEPSYRSVMMSRKKLPTEVVAERMKEKGKTFIREYWDEKGKRVFEYRCSCGRINTIRAQYFSNSLGDGCHWCVAAAKRVSFEQVVSVFTDAGLVMDDTPESYKNNQSRLKCHCDKCGWHGDTSYSYVQQGCRPCNCPTIERGEKRRGENHPMYGRTGELHPHWNPNKTDEERERERHYYEYEQWRLAVFKKHNYTCQVCGQRGGGLRAHHLFPYSEYKELRLSLENGVCVCAACHDPNSEAGFHRIFGTRGNTPWQFWAYVKWRQEQLGINDIDEEADQSIREAV